MVHTTKRATSDSSSANVASTATSPPHDPETTQHLGTDRARRKAESVGQQAAVKKDELKRTAAAMSDDMTAKAREAATQAKQSGVRYAHEKKARLAEELGVFSGAIRKASDKLHDEHHDSIASYVDAAAEQLDCCRQSIESKEVGELVDDAQDFVRRRPEVVYGGLFVAGLAAMRFLKASPPPRKTTPSRRTTERDLSDLRDRPSQAVGHSPIIGETRRSPIGHHNQEARNP